MAKAQHTPKPNVLFIITDDQSYPHASAYGYEAIATPAFDYIADNGLLFANAYTQAPGCSPSRASILTGLHIWQLEEAGSHAAGFDPKFKGYQEILEETGYHTGFTGKGWSPGDYKVLGRTQNPAGKEYNQQKIISPDGMSFIDYYKNFRSFLDEDSTHQPFSFWFGGQEPHRVYKQGVGIARGIDTSKIVVPDFLPRNPIIVSDMADYLLEIEWLDQQVGRALDMLADRGLLENTIIIYTSDNGMPFPRAKGNIFEYGTHVPLAIMWLKNIKEPALIDNPVGLIDIMPMLLESGGIDIDSIQNETGYKLSGNNVLRHIEKADPVVYSARERHSSARWNNLPYSSRSIRKGDYLLVYNYFPERWPAGAPQQLNADGSECCQGFDDIDNSPSLKLLMDGDEIAISNLELDVEREGPGKYPKKYGEYIALFGELRPQVELYNVVNDPACIINLAPNQEFIEMASSLKRQLFEYLKETNDPRLAGDNAFDKYPRRVGNIKTYPKPEWAK